MAMAITNPRVWLNHGSYLDHTLAKTLQVFHPFIHASTPKVASENLNTYQIPHRSLMRKLIESINLWQAITCSRFLAQIVTPALPTFR